MLGIIRLPCVCDRRTMEKRKGVGRKGPLLIDLHPYHRFRSEPTHKPSFDSQRTLEDLSSFYNFLSRVHPLRLFRHLPSFTGETDDNWRVCAKTRYIMTTDDDYHIVSDKGPVQFERTSLGSWLYERSSWRKLGILQLDREKPKQKGWEVDGDDKGRKKVVMSESVGVSRRLFFNKDPTIKRSSVWVWDNYPVLWTTCVWT